MSASVSASRIPILLSNLIRFSFYPLEETKAINNLNFLVCYQLLLVKEAETLQFFCGSLINGHNL